MRGLGFRLGYCLLALNDYPAAHAILRSEVARYPDLVEARNALGLALASLSRHEEAVAVLGEAAVLAPGAVEVNNNLANVLSELGRHAEALPYLQRVIAAQPGLAAAHHNLGTLFQALRRPEEARESFATAARLAPGMSYTVGDLIWASLAVCRWHGLEAQIEQLRAETAKGIAAAPFTFLAVVPSPMEQRRCAENHARAQGFTGAVPAPAPAPARAPAARRKRIRLGYFSADFSDHATAYLTARLFEVHDRSGFEVLGISYGADDGSPMRRRLERSFDRFVDLRAMGDDQAVGACKALEIDIAVDLKGYTTGARPGLLARRIAPVQVSYLGFPGTMGASFIDYLIADRVVLPEAEQGCYSEQLVYLPHSYQVTDSSRVIAARAPTREEAGLPQSAFVFCCFNNTYKIAAPVFAAWMRLLAAVPGSVLWLLEDSEAAKRNLLAAAARAGVPPERLVFAARMPNAEHLARHRLADLFLDTLPYNAHTTASDALWAGLPVLTCQGSAFAGRVAASLLQSVGLPEMVTTSPQTYEALALELARQPARLAALRERLLQARGTAPLFDTVRFARHLESAYRAMYETWLAGLPPRGFAVPPLS